MENQKPNDGSARDLGREGAGSSMGKDMSTGGFSSGGNRDLGSGAGSSKDMGTTSGEGQAVSNKISDLSKNVTQTVGKNTDSLHKGIDKAADSVQPVVDRMASTAHTSVDKVSGALTDASAAVDSKSRELGEAYQHFADTGRAYVRKSPVSSVLVALAAGYTIARLFNRR